MLYGTDIAINSRNNNTTTKKQAQQIVNDVWLDDWKYFSSDEILTQNDKVKEYQGLKLPVAVLNKIYHDNTIRMFPGLGQGSIN